MGQIFFYTVDHNILIKKLELYRIRGTELLRFTSNLNERTQVCKLGKTLSQEVYKNWITTGQIWVTCLSDSTPALFAVTGTSIQDIESKLNGELNNLHCWLLANKLTLNASKSEYMIIGSRKRLLPLDTDPHVFIIDRVDNTKTLGIFTDENITWKTHINHVCKKVSKSIGVLRRAKRMISMASLERLFNALVLPHFDYCSLVWDNCSAG